MKAFYYIISLITVSLLVLLFEETGIFVLNNAIFSGLLILLFSYVVYRIDYRIDENAKQGKRELSNLDVVKYLCSILIILCHLRPFVHYDEVIDMFFNNIVTRIGVPCFFVMTGYLVSLKEKENPAYIDKYTKRTIPMYLLWSVIYLPFLGLLAYENMDVVQQYMEIFHVNIFLLPLAIIPALFVLLFYSGAYYHLWYFPALLCALWVMKKWKKRFRPVSLLVIAFVLLIFGATETYYGIFPEFVQTVLQKYYYGIFFTTRNFLFFGLFYVTLGYAMGYYNREHTKHSLCGLLVSIGLLALEAVFLHSTNRLNSNIMFACIPTSYFLVSSALYIKQYLHVPFPYRAYSKYYYLLHPMVIAIAFSTGMLLETSSPFVQIAGILLATHLLSLLVMKIGKKFPKLPL